MAKKKTKAKMIFKKIIIWLVLIALVAGFVLPYAITALSSN